ncbi:hypothetical protein [Xanthocytophaga agilis]|uniref:Uncharacterized protein n=1 Tax=Xanthocytophaga agilis TaxID=3048010 RepID=A0AAE3RB59_9BACT|nr:hypothetical protein [Xanthocytophaga agilis]MDJ1504927.1 hypothetical protein [Xanthocytophaga agilis]
MLLCNQSIDVAMCTIRKNLIYGLFLVVSCITSSKNIQNGFAISKSCTCSPLKGWVDTYKRKIVYRYDPTSVKINGLLYHPVTFDYKEVGKRNSGYLRINQDTVFWLDTTWETESILGNKLRKEQVFAILSPNQISNWELHTSSALLQSHLISLKGVIKSHEELIYEYEFKVENKSFLGSDYLTIKQMSISKERGIISLVLQSSDGEKAVCTF